MFHWEFISGSGLVQRELKGPEVVESESGLLVAPKGSGPHTIGVWNRCVVQYTVCYSLSSIHLLSPSYIPLIQVCLSPLFLFSL